MSVSAIALPFSQQAELPTSGNFGHFMINSQRSGFWANVASSEKIKSEGQDASRVSTNKSERL